MKTATPVAPDIYHYPSLIMRFPHLIRLVHWVSYLFQLRKWYVMKHWTRLLKESTPSFTALDFGGGEAQYLIPFVKAFPLATFYNLDKLDSNITFIQHYPAANVKGVLMDLEKKPAPIQGDLALCIGVLHYIQQDEVALQHIYDSLLPDGKLLFYTPISSTPLEAVASAYYPDYDSIHKVQHVYSSKSILDKLTNQGFHIVETVTCYGYLGQRVHRVVKALQTRIYYGRWWLKLFSMIGLMLFFPFQLIGMTIDFYTPHKSGNGFLVVAQKATKVQPKHGYSH